MVAAIAEYKLSIKEGFKDLNSLICYNKGQTRLDPNPHYAK